MNILTDEEIFDCLPAEENIMEFARAVEAAVLSKLAEQNGIRPVATVVISTTGMFAGIKRNLVLHQDAPLLFDGDKLYTETQYIAAQQKAAEACAKLAANGVGTGAYNDCCPNTDWEEVQDAIASAIRNGDWRKYYE